MGEISQRREVRLKNNWFIEELKNCKLCPHNCGVNRLRDEKGVCRVGRYAIISSYGPHYGEEKVLVGKGGSGTIFFSYCNLKCVFCQNYEISHLGEGREVKPEELADIMLYLQNIGCENINLVSPTHVIAQIVESIHIAKSKGLKLPIVYNTGGYDKVETLKKLEGLVDIYMPDIKYGDSQIAYKYSGIKNYWEVVREAVKEMHRQVGDLIIKKGIAKKGLLIRHLVLPNRLANSFKVLDFIKNEISEDSYVNIMPQYYPCWKAFDYPELSRRITYEEYYEVVEYAKKIGLKRGIPLSDSS